MNKLDRLNRAALSKLPLGVKSPSYEPASITAGIVHFGIGNFHRAHQAVYCDALLNEGETSWGITGVSMRSSSMRDNLLPQNFLYTQATIGDTTSYRIISAIQNLLVSPEKPQAVIDAVADNKTQLVTTTITEKGYCLSSGKIDRNHPDIIRDIESLNHPQTVYGYLAAALIKRSANQGAPLTILCCDNLHAGGMHLQNGVHLLLENHSPETLNWLVENVAFSSSMVDRVTPATDESLIKEVADRLGLYDAAPVAAEPFTQWVIENNFAGERPPFDRVGALFVNDIAPYEHIKLRFLNAGHSILATLGYLAADRFVHEALLRPALARFTEDALKCNVLPVTQVPDGVSGEDYIDEVLERFRNQKLPYAVLQVGSDSSQKIQQRWLPTIDDALAQEKNISYMAFALAVWVCFIHKALVNDDLNDPLRDGFASVIEGCDLSGKKTASAKTLIQKFLALAGANRFAFFSNESFMAMVEIYFQSIKEFGVEQALATTQFLQQKQ